MKNPSLTNHHPSKLGRLALWFASAAIAWLCQSTSLAVIAQVKLLSPANQASDVSPCVTLTWEKASGATGYEYEVKAATTVIAAGGSGGATELALTLPDNTTITWRVRGRTSANNGAWSASRTFTTKPPIPAPALSYPFDGETIPYADVNIMMEWTPAAGSTGSDLEVYKNGALVLSESTGVDSYIEPFTTGNYQWRVRGKTSCRVGAWSALRSFNLIAPPPPPILIAPADQANGTGLKPTFSWLPVPNATSYEMEISQNGTIIQSSPRTSPTTNLTLPGHGTYQWRVRSWSIGVPGNWSAPRSFTTTTPLPQSLIVTAGPDLDFPIGTATALTAVAVPVNTTAATNWLWEKVSGPGRVYSRNWNAPRFEFGVTSSGTYVFKVTASNGVVSGSDTVTIIFRQPVLSIGAGPDQEVPFPWNASLAGSVLVDEKPNSEATMRWRKSSGPGALAFSNPTGVSTSVTASAPGEYWIILEGWYQGRYTLDTMRVGFGVQLQPPVANASVSSRPRMEGAKGPDGSFQLTVFSPADRICSLQRSENLVDWTDWQMVYPVDGMAGVGDPDGSRNRQFYRLKTQ